ncbi:hypothetical protein LCGC14_2558750, partial [marine sediment metagenome]
MSADALPYTLLIIFAEFAIGGLWVLWLADMRGTTAASFIKFGAALVFVSAGLAFWIARSIVSGLALVGKAAEGISVGDLDQNVDVKSKDEIGDMARSFQRMIAYMKEMAGVAEHIAEGDLTVTVEAKSEKDTLGNAFTSMVGYLKNVAGAAEQIADGDLTVDVHAKSRQDVLGNAFAKTIA